MPCFDIVKKVTPDKTFRVSSVISNFDLDVSHIDEHFTGNIDIEDKEWNVGLIVGGSGTGKSTIAKQCFPDAQWANFEYNEKSVIDDMPRDSSVKEIELAFTSVGFASPPSWLKPYNVLSNGEKMRCDLARAILEVGGDDIIVFDEFTSVVNREVAKTSSYAISKAIRRKGKKFIAVSCHKDIVDWLEPDWIYDTDQKCFFIARESTTAHKFKLTYTGLTQDIKEKFGTYLGSITI